MALQPIFQRFEFMYPNGERFWDRSGQLAFALRSLMPKLRMTKSMAEQRDFTEDGSRRELFYGTTTAALSSWVHDDGDFIRLAAGFLAELSAIFDVPNLTNFGYRCWVGHRCSTRNEADELFWPLIGKEGQEKIRAVAPDGKPQAFQVELRQGPVDATVRFAILDFEEESGKTYPYVGAMYDVKGREPIRIAEFDAAAFMKNVITGEMKEILSRLAPHLHDSNDSKN